MIWNSKELKTMGDHIDVIAEITKANDQAAADKYMKMYREICPHADTNIGYATGYFSKDDSAKMKKLFNVSHPIFGKREPTTKEALEAGKNLARKDRALYGIEN